MIQIKTRHYDWRETEILKQSGLSPTLAKILNARGITDLSQIDTRLTALPSYSTLMGIDSAVDLLIQKITNREKITVIADYDCDGATACAVAVRGLRLLGANIDYIVPNRFEFGYGLTPEIVDLTSSQTAPSLILTVDNGIASVDGVKRARELNIPVLITDHHLPGDVLPTADAIVNPNQPGCKFPSKNLAGVGVMFYVLLALRAKMRELHYFDVSNQPRLDSLLDLVALGTVADVVRLDSVNRLLVANGIKRIRAKQMCMGISALFLESGREAGNCSPFDLGFAIGPRLNAAGRLADMSLGIECLITEDWGRATTIAGQLNTMNSERKEIEKEMQEIALAQLDDFNPNNASSLCVFDPSWHQGVIGILASRLKEKFHRPTIAFAPSDGGILKGSGRSISGFHLRDAIDLVTKKNPGLVLKFGGHAMAAGLTIKTADLDVFKNCFEEVAIQSIDESSLLKLIETDGELEIGSFNLDFAKLLEQYVWGQGFPSPTFCNRFRVISQRVLKEKHLKLTVEFNGQQFDAIWFGQSVLLEEEALIVFRLSINEYNGRTNLQLMIEHAHSI